MKTIEDLAREVGLTLYEYKRVSGREWSGSRGTDGLLDEDLARFAAAVRREALEDSANLIEGYPHWLGPNAKREVAAAIRSLQSPPSPEGTA